MECPYQRLASYKLSFYPVAVWQPGVQMTRAGAKLHEKLTTHNIYKLLILALAAWL